MKKYLTAAALFAAGTALANAATITIAEDFFPTSDTVAFRKLASSSVSDLLFSTHTGYAAYNNIFHAVSAGSWYQVGVNGEGDSSTTAVGATWNSAAGTLGIGCATGMGGGTIAYMWNTISKEDLASVSDLSLTFDVSADEAVAGNTLSVAVYYIPASSTVYGDTVYLGGADILLSDAGSQTIALGAVSAAEDGKFAIAVRESGTTWAESTKTTLSNLSFTGTAIPEPSAFGLIAGAGALALAVSRRRRKA